MNRPNINDYRSRELHKDYYDFTLYEIDLGMYCDELEKTLKVCKFVISNGTNKKCSNCPFKNECDYENSKCNKLEEWKEWLFEE